QNLVKKGLLRDDLFTVVFEQVKTDTCAYGDVLLPATTFLEHRELARGYGSLVLNSYEAAVLPVGEARTNMEVFGELVKRMNFAKPDDVYDDRELARMILKTSRDREALMSAVGDKDG